MLTGRVAILKRNGQEIRMLCPDQDAALKWMEENWQRGDEWVAIVWLEVLLRTAYLSEAKAEQKK